MLSATERQKGIEPLEVLDICKKYLGKQWEAVNETNFDFKVLAQGFGNRLFICGVKDGTASDGVEPKQVLVRLYGGNFLPRDAPIRTLTQAGEVLVFYALSQQGLGPNIYGAFDGGRIEQFIPSRNLTLDEFCENDAISDAIAKRVAHFHAVDIPVQKSPWDILKMSRDCMKKFEEGKGKGRLPPPPPPRSEREARAMAEVMSFDVEAELQWIEKVASQIKSRVVFCHNDINRTNILVTAEDEALSWDERLMLIDFEFCGYSFRGADIGNHFTMKVFDFGAEKMLTGRGYPDEETRRRFIRSYLDECKKIPKFAADWDEDGVDSVDNVLMETEFYCAAIRVLGQAWFFRDMGIFGPMMAKLQEANADMAPGAFLDFYKERKAAFFKRYPQFA